MKIYAIPEILTCIVFDIDSTLYTNQDYAHEQVDVQIRHFATLMHMTDNDAREAVNTFRTEYRNTHGKSISLGNTLAHFGIPISESVKWRETLIEPARYLKKDERLASTLAELAKRYELVAVTNNPVLPARKTLTVLGVDTFFPVLIGLDTTGFSKPHRKPFILAAESARTPLSECLSVGDRYDIDIALPLELGMGGVLVDGVEDVYLLPELPGICSPFATP
ncbi:MAG TPA: HAD family hydrolase [Treponemataceae bacterium]|jgi:phosphoglycolate phosphatase/putative hydrolase of the HAD superfamily|nr:MAG: Flavin mononucleotide phosphatase YigB [Spirochaetes bacterium ADurb.Bin269]HOC28197.1 HAD family hydrolase [Treponemataceae bacterium]HPX48263.1 HAD family hydrolase [Treponemataceae bacterium]HQL32708.1 HAD family hydrolase [Treponemataceae bacterium]